MSGPALLLAEPTTDTPAPPTLDGEPPRIEGVCQLCLSHPLKRIRSTDAFECRHCDRGCTTKPCEPCQLAGTTDLPSSFPKEPTT